MTIWWVDPFLEATTQGNGTTDTTTENGTYAAPFSITRLRTTSSNSQAGPVGTSYSYADGDEVRIKGLPFSTLFESKGNVYVDGGSPFASLVDFKPVTSNSSFDATVSNTKSAIFAFQNSDISSFFPGWDHPAFFAANYQSTSTLLKTVMGSFAYAAIDQQLGHNSASSTGINVFRLKDTYANPFNEGSSGGKWFTINKKVKISGGWTSETAQEGYSILEAFNTTNYKYMYFNNSTTTRTHYDCGRLIVCYVPRSTAGYNNNIWFRGNYSQYRYEATAHVAPIFLSGSNREDYYYPDIHAGSSTVFPWIVGSGDYNTQRLRIYIGVEQTVRSATFQNILMQGYLTFMTNHPNCTTSFGNLYIRANDVSGIGRTFENSTSTSNKGGTFKFLQNSVYFYAADNQSLGVILAPDPDKLGGGSVTYETGLKKFGLAPLNNLSASSEYGPTKAGDLQSASLFRTAREISTNNTWFTEDLSRSAGSNPIEYCSLGELTCNGNNFRTTAHNITVSTASAASASDAPDYVIWSSEHNDYDGLPISILGDPYTAGTSYGVLMYNDTVSSTDVLVGQWSGTTGGASSQAWIPLELSVPSYTAASDNLRAKITVAYADGASNTAAGSVLLRAWHRDTTQSANFRVYSSSATSVSAGGDPTSTTTVTLNLSNVATSGQDDITSVLLGIRLDFTDNTNIQKYYIASAEIETY